jgi:hypothetical protein
MCGKMDQVCAHGNKLLRLKFVKNEVSVEEKAAADRLNIMIVDLKGKKNTSKILMDLNSRYPIPKSEEDELLFDALGKTNHAYVQAAETAIVNGEMERLGELMKEAQFAFDRQVAVISPEELKAKRLHEILADEYIKGFVYGGKGVGSQGDGCAQFLLKSEAYAGELEQYIKEKYGYDTFLVSTNPKESIKKAVIPLAGYASRLYPASKVIEKSLLPVLDRDGRLKPALVIQLEELIKSGIEKICLVIREDQMNIKELFEFKYAFEEENDYFEKLKELETHLEFVIQKEKKGFGAAVLESRDFSEEVCVAGSKISRQFYQAEYGDISSPMVPFLEPKGAANSYAVAVTDPELLYQSRLEGGLKGNVRVNTRINSKGKWKIMARVRGMTMMERSTYTAGFPANQEDPAEGSFEVNIDGKNAGKIRVEGTDWKWVSIDRGTVNLTEGKKVLEFTTGTAGIAIDNILVTNDLSFVPANSDNTNTISPSAVKLRAEKIAADAALTFEWRGYTIKPPFVKLVWDPSTAPQGVRYYNIYRDSQADFKPGFKNLIGSTSELFFLDTNLNPGTYHYKLVAIDNWDNHSVPSDEVPVNVVNRQIGY